MPFFLLILSLFYTEVGLCQTHPTIRTGRPGKSIGPFVLGHDWVQIQSGLEHKRLEGERVGENNLLGTVIRFGLDESWEINGRLNYTDTTQRLPTYNPRNSRVNAFNLGFRYNIVNNPQKTIKGLGFQTHFKVANDKGEFDSPSLLPIFTLASLIQIHPEIRLISNIGTTFEETEPSPFYFATLNFAHNLNDKWGSFLEIFANRTGSINRAYLDGGVFFLLNPDLQLDAAFGWGNNQSQTEYFVDIGVSWRFHTNER